MEPVIEIQGLQKSFDGNEVLRNISLTLARGENLAILGKSGQGKSVTIKCVVGLLTQDAGSLKVFGEEVKDMNEDSLKELRIKVGFLFQGAALYDSMTVRENMRFPLQRVLKIKDEAEIEKRIVDVLAAVGLEDAIDKMPSDLSGGMRKRMGLARTLVVRPEVILYDEPTTGLDSITSKEISKLIVDLQKKYQTSSIIITHDMSCAKITANRILIIHEGEFIAEGTYESLEKADNDLVRSFFN